MPLFTALGIFVNLLFHRPLRRPGKLAQLSLLTSAPSTRTSSLKIVLQGWQNGKLTKWPNHCFPTFQPFARMTLTATFPWANPATVTGPARVDTPVSSVALPCWFSTRPASDASLPPQRTATFRPRLPRQRTRSNKAAMAATAAMAMTNRAPHPLRGLRPRTSEGFRISLDLNPSGPMDLGPPADRLFLHCPPILTSQRGLSLWTKIPATQIYSPPSNKIPEWYSFVLSFSSKEKIFFWKSWI